MGLQKATGDYVWFINAGDTLCSSDTVQSIVSKLQKRKVLPDIIYGETNHRRRGKAVAGTAPPQGAAEALVEELQDGDVGLATSRSYQNVRLPRHMICNIAIRPISTGVTVA